jgi:fluoride exporter
VIPLVIALGAAVGAPARYLTERAVRARYPAALPWGTLLVNVVASFVLGLVAGAAVPATQLALVGTGFCGALSTFSTFSFETDQLVRTGRWSTAVLYVALSVLLGLAAVSAGWTLGGG